MTSPTHEQAKAALWIAEDASRCHAPGCCCTQGPFDENGVHDPECTALYTAVCEAGDTLRAYLDADVGEAGVEAALGRIAEYLTVTQAPDLATIRRALRRRAPTAEQVRKAREALRDIADFVPHAQRPSWESSPSGWRYAAILAALPEEE
jgi:hypothetical protein